MATSSRTSGDTLVIYQALDLRNAQHPLVRSPFTSCSLTKKSPQTDRICRSHVTGHKQLKDVGAWMRVRAFSGVSLCPCVRTQVAL